MEETRQEIARSGPKKEDFTKSLVLITVISSFGSTQCGYNLWVVYSPSVLVQDFYNISFGEKLSFVRELSEDKNYNVFLTGVTIALFPLGGTLGSLVVGPLTDGHGRKVTLLVNSIFSMISSVLVACSKVVEGYEFTMISRFATGVCSGIFYTAVPIYLAELSPTNLRGTITLTPHFFLIFGVLMAQTLALREILGTQEGWPILMSMVGILALCQIIIMPSFPESPRYLLIQKGDKEKAREDSHVLDVYLALLCGEASYRDWRALTDWATNPVYLALKKLRNKDDVEDEIEELCQEDLAEKDEKFMNVLMLFSYPDLKRQVMNVIALTCGQQLIGVNAAYFYTERIYIATEVGIDNVRFISILSSAILLSVVFLLMYLIHLVERKTLLLTGFAICGFCCVLLFLSLEYQDTHLWMSYVGSFSVNLFLAGHAIGPSSIPNLLTAEMFLQSSRSSAYVVEGFLYWLIYFITGVTYLHVQAKLENRTFLLFIPFNIAAFIYTFKLIPKTKNKTFLEIRRLMEAQRIQEPTVT